MWLTAYVGCFHYLHPADAFPPECKYLVNIVCSQDICQRNAPLNNWSGDNELWDTERCIQYNSCPIQLGKTKYFSVDPASDLGHKVLTSINRSMEPPLHSVNSSLSAAGEMTCCSARSTHLIRLSGSKGQTSTTCTWNTNKDAHTHKHTQYCTQYTYMTVTHSPSEHLHDDLDHVWGEFNEIQNCDSLFGLPTFPQSLFQWVISLDDLLIQIHSAAEHTTSPNM